MLCMTNRRCQLWDTEGTPTEHQLNRFTRVLAVTELDPVVLHAYKLVLILRVDGSLWQLHAGHLDRM
jgi:hypothetical protein